MTTGEAQKALIDRVMNELKSKSKNVTIETLFTNKAFSLYFLRMLVKIDNDLPRQGFFQEMNKEVLKKYSNAILLLKFKLKKNLI